jgi:hypothetical protein
MFKEDVLLTVNEEYKLKLWLMLPNLSKICKKTCLGPSYGKPIVKLLSFTSFNNNSTIQQHYLVKFLHSGLFHKGENNWANQAAFRWKPQFNHGTHRSSWGDHRHSHKQ